MGVVRTAGDKDARKTGTHCEGLDIGFQHFERKPTEGIKENKKGIFHYLSTSSFPGKRLILFLLLQALPAASQHFSLTHACWFVVATWV